MRSLIERLRWLRRQGARLVIEAQSSDQLSLRSDRTLFVFDRLSRAVTQNDRQVATLGSINSVRIEEEATDAGQSTWLVTLQLTGSRVVTIGRTPDESAASAAASGIATIAGVRVVAIQGAQLEQVR